MKPTTPGLPLTLAVVGAALGYLLQVALVASGRAAISPPYTFALSLLAIAAAALILGWPIRQAVRGRSDKRVDPFRATHVVVLAKASVLVGALLGGAALGVVAHIVGRPVLGSGDDLPRAVLAVAAAAVTVVAGLIAERWCRVPPDDRDGDVSSVGLRGE